MNRPGYLGDLDGWFDFMKPKTVFNRMRRVGSRGFRKGRDVARGGAGIMMKGGRRGASFMKEGHRKGYDVMRGGGDMMMKGGRRGVGFMKEGHRRGRRGFDVMRGKERDCPPCPPCEGRGITHMPNGTPVGGPKRMPVPKGKGLPKLPPTAKGPVGFGNNPYFSGWLV